MGMHLGKSIVLVAQYQNHVADVFRQVEKEKLTFDEYLSLYANRIVIDARCPRWIHSEVDGFRDGMYRAFTMHVVENRWSLNGKLYVEGEEKERAFKGNYHLVRYEGLWYRGSDKQFVAPKS